MQPLLSEKDRAGVLSSTLTCLRTFSATRDAMAMKGSGGSRGHLVPQDDREFLVPTHIPARIQQTHLALNNSLSAIRKSELVAPSARGGFALDQISAMQYCFADPTVMPLAWGQRYWGLWWHQFPLRLETSFATTDPSHGMLRNTRFHNY